MLYSVALLCLCVGMVAGQPNPPDCGYRCINGAQCEWTGEGEQYHCNCPEGYIGKVCEKKLCSHGGECYNGGLCETTVGDEAWCKCPEGFTGHYCETHVESCQTSMYGCNSGECHVNDDGSDYCICPPGAAGHLCEYPPEYSCDSCSPNPNCPWTARGECVGYCPTSGYSTMCYICNGLMTGDNDDNLGRGCFEYPELSPTDLCDNGCMTTHTYRNGEYVAVSRRCIWDDCYDECEDYISHHDGEPVRSCNKCCYNNCCNTDRPYIAEGASVALSSVTTSLAFMMAIVLA